jgi:beta-lactamase superfamily II metal-dependent hydrolase
MSTTIHFLNVGQGNMVVVVFPDNTVLVCDCNITESNKLDVLAHLVKIMPSQRINVFVNSHRDADHMRGVAILNAWYPIGSLWDSGVSGNIDTAEYRSYMQLRRNLGSSAHEVSSRQTWREGAVRILNGKRDKGDINSQSVVLKISHAGSSVLLAGDTDAIAWRDFIVPEAPDHLPSDILLGSHHGALTFFDDPRDEKHYYTQHLQKISPAITVLSVGDNAHGHPEARALEFYEKHSRGSKQGNKLFRTDLHGNIRLQLRDDGGWSLNYRQ